MSSSEVVFFFDVDNTLLDNDRIIEDLATHLDQKVGHERQQRYWIIFEQLRTELGYADYLGALQRYRTEYPRDPNLLTVSRFLIQYPFADRLYPKALAVVASVSRWSKTVILSDGDVVFQPHKIERSGLWNAVEGRVLVYAHKERMLDDVERRYPARRYVMVDDKLRILAAMKEVWGDRLTTIFPRQGHYARDSTNSTAYPRANLTIDRIGDLATVDVSAMLAPAGSQPTDQRKL